MVSVASCRPWQKKEASEKAPRVLCSTVRQVVQATAASLTQRARCGESEVLDTGEEFLVRSRAEG